MKRIKKRFFIALVSYFFYGHGNEEQSIDKLTSLTYPLQLKILKYIAHDTEQGEKTIRSLLWVNKYWNKLCGSVKEIRSDFSKPEILKQQIIKSIKPNEKNSKELFKLAQEFNNLKVCAKVLNEYWERGGNSLEEICIDNKRPENLKKIIKIIKPNEKNSKELFNLAQKYNNIKVCKKILEQVSIEPSVKENVQDCFSCVLPKKPSPWEDDWEKECTLKYISRIEAKYGLKFHNPMFLTYNKNYLNYRKSREIYLGCCLHGLMYSMKLLFQVSCCPCICCSIPLYEHKIGFEELMDFKEGTSTFGWCTDPLFSWMK